MSSEEPKFSIPKLIEECSIVDFETWQKIKTQEEWELFIKFNKIEPNWGEIPDAERLFYYFKVGRIVGNVNSDTEWIQKLQELKEELTKSRKFWLKEYNACNRKDERSEAMCECLMRIDEELENLINQTSDAKQEGIKNVASKK